MIALQHYLQEECPTQIREQILLLMQREWPQASEGKSEHGPWPENPDAHPTSFFLLEDNRVISHVAVPWKYIQHEGETYRVFGLSEVITNPVYRMRGFGLTLVRVATSFIEDNAPDIGIFTCKPSLVSFYTQAGWEYIQHTNLIGGTRDKPFRSDSLGLATMIRFFSGKAQQNRPAFEETDVYLELGENMLW